MERQHKHEKQPIIKQMHKVNCSKISSILFSFAFYVHFLTLQKGEVVKLFKEKLMLIVYMQEILSTSEFDHWLIHPFPELRKLECIYNGFRY